MTVSLKILARPETGMTNIDVLEFFRRTTVSIRGNAKLREPQKEAYHAIAEHLRADGGKSYVQLPVGCGKTGVMGLAPFGTANGRVLIVAPNITVRDTILKELDISKP